MEKDLLSRIRNIRAFVIDLDGVLTDGHMLLLENGERLRSMYVRDGEAIRYAASRKYRFAILQSDKSEAISRQMYLHGVREYFLNTENKFYALEKFLIDNEIELFEILYIGDDFDDVAAMRAAGLACCPADASAEAKAVAQYIAEAKGGKGAVREIIEMVLRSQNQWLV